jgi:hypothetical protein
MAGRAHQSPRSLGHGLLAEPRSRPASLPSQRTNQTVRIMRPKKKVQTQDDDVRAWVIIGLIFFAIALAVWLPFVVERHLHLL